MDWIDKYRLALSYARSHSYDYAKDITHDAWLLYYKKTKLDLFEVPVKNSYIYRTIKYAFYNWLKSTKKTDHKGQSYIYFDAEDISSAIDSPEEAIFGKDMHEYFIKKINEDQRYKTNQNYKDVFGLKVDGYTTDEIAHKLNIQKSLVSYYNKKMSLVNPFNGNKLKITRTINKDTWDKKSDKDDYTRNDYNEWFELWEHNESHQGILVRLNK